MGLWYVWIAHSDVMSRWPRTIMWIAGLVVVKLDVGIMVAHLCQEEYHPFGRTMAVYLFLAFHAAFASLRVLEDANPRVGTYSSIHEDILIAEMALLMTVSVSHMVLSLAHEVSSVCGIWVFTITSKRGPPS